MPALSIIIVTWNGLRWLPACFAALQPQLQPDDEVVLVDNGSTDGTATWCQQHPEVRLVALPRNLGFAGGVAVGTQHAQRDLVVLLNNDAFVAPGCLTALRNAAISQPQFGAFAGVLTFDHMPEVVASAGIRVVRNGLALDLWMGRRVAELPIELVEIFAPSGGLALYRRTALDDVGSTEPTFFNYLEDADLGWRLRLRSWRSAVVPQAQVRHIYSATSGQGSPLKQRLLARNRIWTMIRCLPDELLRMNLGSIISYDLQAIIYGLLRKQPAIVAGRLAALHDFPRLLEQRRMIQARRTAATADLRRWLEPVPWPWQILHEQRRLDHLLQQRVGSMAGVL
jgi:GT2 family glycosyltransferase